MLPDPDDPLIPVPMPALVVLLLELQERLQRPLTRVEGLIARDHCHCVMLPRSRQLEMAVERGYTDIDPNTVWESWQAFLASRASAAGPEK